MLYVLDFWGLHSSSQASSEPSCFCWCREQVRKWTDPVDNGANLLLTVPGGADGPSGVLVRPDAQKRWTSSWQAEHSAPESCGVPLFPTTLGRSAQSPQDKPRFGG